jgi:lipopolysaccharide export system permease protein
MKKIIDRYILKEIALPFFMILFVLTFVLLMGKILQLMDLMVNKGVHILDIGQLILFLMPSFLLFTIPISLLVGIMIALGRLSMDNEITVFKASGISLYQLARPVLLATVIAFGVSILTSYILVPAGNFATKTLLYNLARQKASLGIKEKVFNDDFKGILLYADKVPVSGDYMEGILISDQRMGTEPNTIIARKARLVSDLQSLSVTLRLENGSTHTVEKKMKNYRKMDFSTYDVKLDIGSSVADEKAKTKASTEMTFSELRQQMRSRTLQEKDQREMAIELYKKISIPTSCFVFALLALPLGIRKHRSAKSRGFVLGLFTVLAYYLLRLTGEALVETGKISVFLGTWLPNLALGALGVYLFTMAVRERPLWPFRGRRKIS